MVSKILIIVMVLIDIIILVIVIVNLALKIIKQGNVKYLSGGTY